MIPDNKTTGIQSFLKKSLILTLRCHGIDTEISPITKKSEYIQLPVSEEIFDLDFTADSIRITFVETESNAFVEK